MASAKIANVCLADTSNLTPVWDHFASSRRGDSAVEGGENLSHSKDLPRSNDPFEFRS